MGSGVRAVPGGGRGPRLAGGVPPAGADPRRSRTVPYGDLDVAAALGTPARRPLPAGRRAERGDDDRPGDRAAAPRRGPAQRPAPRRPRCAAVDPEHPGAARRRRVPPGAAHRCSPATAARPSYAPTTRPATGGPRPNSRYAALAMRQRLLSDAALHALSPTPPARWSSPRRRTGTPAAPGPHADFFAGLDQPWLRLVDLPSVVSGGELAPADTSGERTPVYPRSDRRAQLPLANLLATGRLASTGSTYGRLLPDNDTVERRARPAIAMLASSQNVRDDADRSAAPGRQHHRLRARADAGGPDRGPVVRDDVRRGRDRSRSPWSTASTRPVRVGIAAQTRSSGLRIDQVDPVTLGPGKRTAIRLKATSNDIGVHAVTLVATDTEGNPLGSLTQRQRPHQPGEHRDLGDHGRRRRCCCSSPSRSGCSAGCAAARPPTARGCRGRADPDGTSPDATRRGPTDRQPEPATGRDGDRHRRQRAVLQRGDGRRHRGVPAQRLRPPLLLAAALGKQLHADVFTIANTIPNMLYILLAGGVFNAVLVPQLVRAMKNDADGGDGLHQPDHHPGRRCSSAGVTVAAGASRRRC